MTASNSMLIAARRSLIVLAVALTVTAGVFFVTRYLADRAKNQTLQLEQQKIQGDATLQQKQVDAASLREGIDLFEALRAQGMVGSPDREAWVEQLVATRERMGLPNTLTYILQPPKPLIQQGSEFASAAVDSGADPDAPSGPVFHDLDFKISGIHEGELLVLLSTYQSHVKGRFRVNTCALSAPQEAGLSASCTLRFFTLPGSRAKAVQP
jgi:hypothetical protein